ncbi:alpha/beta hydrolase [Candidatus Kaiserbacteria bacterium]|nr:alpha/beta hydrolase [Candidatus Kaiserbacteria bacterium]
MQVIIQNLATEYLDEGSGTAVLFLHGWMDSLHTFDALAALLPPTHRIIRLDLPGFGKTERPKEAWGLDEYVRFVDNFIKKLGVEVDTFVGHSFGGRVILKGAAENIFHADKLVLIGSAGIAKRNTPRHLFFNIIAKLGKVATAIPPLSFWKEKIRRRFYTRIGSDYADAGALQETFLKTISEDLSESAQKIDTPTLLIWGKNDTATPLSDGERLARLIPRAQLEALDGGHFIHRERPEEVVAFIRNFIC